MATSIKKSSVPGMLDAYRYTPGDGRRYVWAGGSAQITVERITVEGGLLVMTDSGDRIDPPAVQTATAFMATVNAWRLTGPA